MELWGGVHDALSTRIMGEAGFDRLWLSSFCVSAARLGRPDDGTLTPDNVLGLLDDIRPVASRPIVVDAENGWDLPFDEVLETATRLFVSGARGLCICLLYTSDAADE